MRLFRRHEPSSSTQVAGLPELAASRGWQPVEGEPFEPRLVDQVWHLTWSLYGQREPLPEGGASSSVVRRPLFRDAYRGELEGRSIVVTNHATNLGVIKLNDWKAVAVCAVELGTLFPVLMIKPRGLPFDGKPPLVPSGDPEFDERYELVMVPLVEPQSVLDVQVRQRVMAHDNWAFLGHDTWLICVRRGPFETADDVTGVLDDVFGIVHALPTSIVPAQIDRSVDDLAARIDKISSVEEALTFLQHLAPEDRARLANSNTPLAAFADVRTPEEAMARLQSLDMPQRMQLLGMFQRIGEP